MHTTCLEETISSQPGTAVRPRYPLSLGQRDVWLQSRLYPDGDVAKLSLMFALGGALDVPVLLSALQSLMERHEILRTVFPGAGSSEPEQEVRPAEGFSIECPLIDCPDCTVPENPEQERQLRIESSKHHAREQQSAPFDLEKGPLVRARLLRFHPEWHCLVLSFHRMILDGMHGAQLMSELGETYRRFKGGMAAPDPPSQQYGDFAKLQAEPAARRQIEENRAFWLRKLEQPLPETPLAFDFDPPWKRSPETALHTHQVPAPLTLALRRVQKECRATAIQIATAALAVLLHRTTGSRHFLIAAPCSTRPRGMSGTAGFFSSILPLRIEVPESCSTHDFLRRVSKEFRDSLDRREFPWTEVLHQLKNQQSRNRTLLPVSVSQIGILARKSSGEPHDLTMIAIGGYGSASSHDLSLVVQEQSRLSLRISYSKALFEERTIVRWGQCLEQILEAFANSPELPVDGIALGSAPDDCERPEPSPILDFGEGLRLCAMRHGGKTAIVHGSRAFTYAELVANTRLSPLGQEDPIAAYVASKEVQGCERRGVDSSLPRHLTSGDTLLVTGLDKMADSVGIDMGLMAGAKVVVVSAEDAGALGRTLVREGITAISISAKQFSVIAEGLPDALDGLRLVVVSGGPVPARLFRKAAAKLRNTAFLYGYSPAGLPPFLASLYLDAGSWSDAEIPTPLRLPLKLTGRYGVRICDRQGRPVPFGFVGRIHLVTPKGVVGTSDLGRLIEPGVLEFAGAADGGYETSPGIWHDLEEIAGVISTHPQVSDAAVTPALLPSGQKRLAAYLSGSVDLKDLRMWLATRLPGDQLPACYTVLPSLPRDAQSGALRASGLPAPKARKLDEYREPKTAEQKLLAGLWEEVLGVEQVGLDDNFFDLGGHSIAAARVHQLARERAGASFPLIAIFEHPTVAGMARLMTDRQAGAGFGLSPSEAATVATGAQSRAGLRAQRRSDQNGRRAVAPLG